MLDMAGAGSGREADLDLLNNQSHSARNPLPVPHIDERRCKTNRASKFCPLRMIFKVHGRADIENHMSSQICFCFKLFNIEPFGFSVHFPVDMFEIISLVVGPVFCKFYRETVERAAMQSGNESLCNCSGFEMKRR